MTTPRSFHGALRAIRSVGRAFTLIEVVVAVGVLAVVTVAIATVFDTVSDTVRSGSRLSTLNRLAFRIETVMQRDFEGLRQGTGFLVIRNEYAQRDWTGDATVIDPDRDAVPVFEGDADARLRRIDEIMFFSNSDRFRTRRAPIHPALVAESGEARIYYGHGQRMPADVDGNGDVIPWADRAASDEDWRFERPRLDDFNSVVVGGGSSARLGDESQSTSFTNPNRFARDWLLLRHVTLLVPPTTETQSLPTSVFGMDPTVDEVARTRLQDMSRQIAGQPAAQSIFQPVAALTPRAIEDFQLDAGPYGIRGNAATFADTGFDFYGYSDTRDESLVTPLFTSGLVDIATTDLAEIRDTVRFGSSTLVPWTPFSVMNGSPIRVWDQTSAGAQSFQLLRRDASTRVANSLRAASPALTTRDQQEQQEWMLGALPSIPFDPTGTNLETPGFRVRAEAAPPNLYPPIREVNGRDLEFIGRYTGSYPPGTSVQELMAAIEQADQEMLVGNVFLPRCTEFIVEWSYGIIDRRPGATQGQPIWHGLRRWQDFDGDGSYNPTSDLLLADVFAGLALSGGSGVPQYDNTEIVETPSGGFAIPDEIEATVSGSQAVSPRIEALTTLRSRANPTNRPDPDDAASVEYVWGYSDVGGGDWPWPTLVRVTLRVADELDPSIEQTYQVVFRVQRPETAAR